MSTHPTAGCHCYPVCCCCHTEAEVAGGAWEAEELQRGEQGVLPGLPLPGLPPLSPQGGQPAPVSGTYYGTGPAMFELVLRVDIDVRYPNSPVLNRISGDQYRVYRATVPGRPARVWRTYLESWIVDAPRVVRAGTQLVVTGSVRFWRGSHPTTALRLVFNPAMPGQETVAEATFTTAAGGPATYTCQRRSSAFRQLQLEVDVCSSVKREPLLPSWDTSALDEHPVELASRTLTVQESYMEAGVEVKLAPEHTELNDTAAELRQWSPAELHDALETHFLTHSNVWPNWQMWGLLAGTFDVPEVGGIMFDVAAANGAAGDAPERRGFALFRKHKWFTHLKPGVPTSQVEAQAMRQFLYTFVHEAGHALNLRHSWDRSSPDALSWMNYDWRYDQRFGTHAFWQRFMFRFDDEELLHLRHGDRAAVIMGGDPWNTGGRLEAPAEATMQLEGAPPLELIIRSSGVFEFMEPVFVELRLRNLMDLPLELDTLLRPEQGGVTFYIRRPDGLLRTYAPALCKLAQPRLRTLTPEGQGEAGADRYSEEVFLSYGRMGFYFDQPGDYLVRAVYQGMGDVLIPSNVHRVHVRTPTRTEELRAQDFFTHPVGLCLYLDGSRSPHLKKGMETLEELAERYEDSSLGARAATCVANTGTRPFHRYERSRFVRLRDERPEDVLDTSQLALNFYRRQTSRAFNLSHHAAANQRAALLKRYGRTREAKQELATLREDLGRRGVNKAVLKDILMREQKL